MTLRNSQLSSSLVIGLFAIIGAHAYFFSGPEHQAYAPYFLGIYGLIAFSIAYFFPDCHYLKNNWVFATVACCCYYLLLYLSLDNFLTWDSDAFCYIAQAKSIIEGDPSAYIKESAYTYKGALRSDQRPTAPIAYQWGFPLLLSPFYAASGLAPNVLKLAGFSAFVLFSITLIIGFKKYHKGVWLYLLFFLVAFNPQVTLQVNRILSDVPYLLLSTISILFIGRLIIEQRTLVAPVFDHILLGIIIASAFLMKPTAALLLSTLLAVQLWCFIKERRHASANLESASISHRISVYLAPYLTFLGMTAVSSRLLPGAGGESSYIEMLQYISPLTLETNIRTYGSLLSEYFRLDPTYFNAISKNQIYVASLFVAFLGLIRRRSNCIHIVIYIVSIYILHVLYPFPGSARQILSIVPFYMSFVISGVESLYSIRMIGLVTLTRTITLGALIFLVILFSVELTQVAIGNARDTTQPTDGPLSEQNAEMLDFVRDHTPPDSIVSSFAPSIMRYYTGRRSVNIRHTAFISHADYLVSYRKSNYWDLFKETVAQGWTALIYKSDTYKIYKVKPLAMRGRRGYSGYVDDNPDLRAAFNRKSRGLTKGHWGKWHWIHYGFREDGRTLTPYTLVSQESR